MAVVLALLIAGAACGALTPIVIVGLRKAGTFDLPNDRSSHTEVRPRGGGIAIAVSVLAALLAAGSRDGTIIQLLLIALALAALGLLDDRRGMSPITRLGIQLLAGVAVGLVVGRASDYSAILLISSVIVMVYVINAFNFMDGINGISSTHGALFALVLAVELLHLGERDGGILAIALVGAVLAFLPYNFPKAQVFLGDVGSYFIGGLLAALAVYSVAVGASLVLILSVFGYYIVDTATTIVVRIRQRANIFEAHRDHLYQLIVRSGRSHTRSAFVALGLSLLGLGSAISISRFLSDAAALALAFVLVLVAVTVIRHRITKLLVQR
jgi:UDP-GlcNAc:undecaprenyl-phosphate GlcNAc-1-phosphate transferase